MINRRRETEIVNGQEFVLQTVSLRWYYETNDKYGMTGSGRKDSAGYMDALLRNTVVSPPGVASKGFGYFEENDDLETAETLVKRIESFLRRGKSGSAPVSAKSEGKQG